jgi:hypothetical protein
MKNMFGSVSWMRTNSSDQYMRSGIKKNPGSATVLQATGTRFIDVAAPPIINSGCTISGSSSVTG